MNDFPLVQLGNENFFKIISGLWTGKKPPFIKTKILRSTNFRGDGLFDFEDVPSFDVEERQFNERALERGDIVIERSGGGPKQPVGRVAYFDPPTDDRFCISNFTSAIRVVDKSAFDELFVSLYLHHLYLAHETESLQRATNGIRNLDWGEYQKFNLPMLSIKEQKNITYLLNGIRKTYRLEEKQLEIITKVKKFSVQKIFKQGLHGAPPKETEIGPVPDNWKVVSLGSLGRVGNGSTPKKTVLAYWDGGTYPWLTSAKVYDREIVSADQFVTPVALKKCHLPKVKPGSVLMAITGQGKTLGNCAVLKIEAAVSQHIAYFEIDEKRANSSFIRGYLETQYEYLRQVAAGGGSTKGALTCAFLRDLQIPLPSLEEQREMASVFESLDGKIKIHKQRKIILGELFQTLLKKLMTNEIRIADLDLSPLNESEKVEAIT